MSATRLSKLHATGNDFLVCDGLPVDGFRVDGSRVDGSRVDGPRLPIAAQLCDRHRGIGADGLIVMLRGGDGADCRMVLFNADGQRAEMSGNGIRCLAWFAVRSGLGDGNRLVIDTDGGRRAVDYERGPSGAVVGAVVDMGPARFDPEAIPLDGPTPFDLTAEFHGVEYRGDAVGMGNPHLVLFVDDPATARVAQHGPRLEHDPRFPQRTNVEFVAVTSPDALTMRVWERGVGETLSCGTGACAAAAVAHRRGLVGERVVVHVPGGQLTVELGDTIALGGPVVHVFDVDVDLDALLRGFA